MKFGWKYYLEPTPRNVQKLMLGVRGILYSLMGTALVTDKVSHTTMLCLLVVMYAMEELSKLLTPDQPPTQKPEEPAQ